MAPMDERASNAFRIVGFQQVDVFVDDDDDAFVTDLGDEEEESLSFLRRIRWILSMRRLGRVSTDEDWKCCWGVALFGSNDDVNPLL